MATIRADDLVTDFAKRLPSQGGFVSAKQTDFALSVWRRENPNVAVPRGSADGVLVGPDGEWAGTWALRRTPTGAGVLTLRWFSPADGAKAQAEESRQACLRALNDQIAAAYDAGDREAVGRLLDESRPLVAASPVK